MKLSISALTLLGMAASSASALNVIREWGGHVLHEDYEIDLLPGYGDVGVRITANPHPEIPWKFEAFDADTHAPGDIDYILIDSTQPVADIQLSVIGNPNGNPPHAFGARDLKAINLTANGTSTNAIVDIKLARNLATDDSLIAPGLSGICLVGDPENLETGLVLHPVVLDEFTGSLTCNGLGDFTVSPGCPGEEPCGNLTAWGPYVNTMTIAGAGIETLTLGYDGAPLTGQIHIAGNITHLDLDGGTRTPALVEVGGQVRTADIDAGLGAGSVVRLGSVGPGILQQHCSVHASFDQTVHMDGLLDIIGVGGDVHIHCQTRGQVHVGGDVQIFASDGDVTSAAIVHLEGNITRHLAIGSTGDDDPNGYMPPASLLGQLWIAGDFTHPDPNDSLGLVVWHGSIVGTLTIGGNLAAPVWLPDGTISGTLSVGSLTSPGHIVVGDANHPQVMSGAIDIHGDLDGGLIEIYGTLFDPNVSPAAGHIAVDGSFGASQTSTISVSGGMGSSGSYVCVDFDGYDEDDRWGPYGTVQIGGVAYHGNTPAQRIYEITMCKGDSNNDGYVDFVDNSSMLLAIQNPHGYEIAYPGLAGSRLFHCDIGGPINNQCDGLVNMLDFQLFRLRWGCCSDECGLVQCNNLTAGQTASVLAESVSADLQPELAAVVSEIATDHPEAPVREYWQAVQELLPE